MALVKQIKLAKMLPSALVLESVVMETRTNPQIVSLILSNVLDSNECIPEAVVKMYERDISLIQESSHLVNGASPASLIRRLPKY